MQSGAVKVTRWKTLPEAFLAQAPQWRERNAFSLRVEDQWKRRTWGQYYDAVQRTARALLALGVRAGAKICIFGKNPSRPEWAILLIAAMSVGVVPIVAATAVR
jgi:long-subunit acyl-CoA synthetase (AMP-forming)